jgi:hypothetical protein
VEEHVIVNIIFLEILNFVVYQEWKKPIKNVIVKRLTLSQMINKLQNKKNYVNAHLNKVIILIILDVTVKNIPKISFIVK